MIFSNCGDWKLSSTVLKDKKVWSPLPSKVCSPKRDLISERIEICDRNKALNNSSSICSLQDTAILIEQEIIKKYRYAWQDMKGGQI